MDGVPDTSIGRMYRSHIEMILAKDINGLLDQYTEDAVLISSFTGQPVYFRGRDELRTHFEGILGIDDLASDVAFWAETENPDTLMVVEKITMTAGGSISHMRFADSWVINNGRIAIHFAGMTQYPDGTVA